MGQATTLPARWDQQPQLDLLQSHRSRLSTYALEHAWVDKDPRLCITYPAYLHIFLRRIPLVVALREPLAVATSLHFRNGFSLNRGLVLWWIYNHHIASQLCSKDLLTPYSFLLNLDVQNLNQFFGSFLERISLNRPSDHQAQTLISSLLKPEFNRAEDALNADSCARIHPQLMTVCHHAYERIIQAGDQIACYKEQFDVLPRAVLECSESDQLLPETEVQLLHQRLHSIGSEMHAVSNSLAQQQQDCALLHNQLADLQSSHSWRITEPLRIFVDFLRSLSA